MKYIVPAIRFKMFMIVLLGLVYPFIMTGVSQIVFPRKASGDFIQRNKQIVGSRWIGQKFERADYFWPRPSAVDYNPLPSGGSNLAQSSLDLKKLVEERKLKLKKAHSEQTGEPPHDLLFASGSGVDPHIGPEAAQYQLQRVANARNMKAEQIQQLIAKATEGRSLGIFGEPAVNVLVLNLSLDKAQALSSELKQGDPLEL